MTQTIPEVGDLNLSLLDTSFLDKIDSAGEPSRFNGLPDTPQNDNRVSRLKPNETSMLGTGRHEDGSIGGLLDAAMQIAAERNDVLRSMRAALESGDDEVALDYARRLCGLHVPARH